MAFEVVDNDVLRAPKGVIDELAQMITQYHRWQAADADRRQSRMMQDRTVVVRKDARCVPTLAIDPYVYHHLALRMGSYACWDDPDFVDYVERYMAVRTRPVSEALSVAPGFGASKLDTRKEPVFRKSYGEI